VGPRRPDRGGRPARGGDAAQDDGHGADRPAGRRAPSRFRRAAPPPRRHGVHVGLHGSQSMPARPLRDARVLSRDDRRGAGRAATESAARGREVARRQRDRSVADDARCDAALDDLSRPSGELHRGARLGDEAGDHPRQVRPSRVREPGGVRRGGHLCVGGRLHESQREETAAAKPRTVARRRRWCLHRIAGGEGGVRGFHRGVDPAGGTAGAASALGGAHRAHRRGRSRIRARRCDHHGQRRDGTGRIGRSLPTAGVAIGGSSAAALSRPRAAGIGRRPETVAVERAAHALRSDGDQSLGRRFHTGLHRGAHRAVRRRRPMRLRGHRAGGLRRRAAHGEPEAALEIRGGRSRFTRTAIRPS